jgi:hypothetical protein
MKNPRKKTDEKRRSDEYGNAGKKERAEMYIGNESE